ncbi:MAG: hypothetical protein IKI15_04805 [Lachnospiraceae bacterium]|nr:hypothetical protein [Lachnospiraceae bacterium]
MKKKKIIIILTVVLVLLVLLFMPFRVDTLSDGGSKVYSAVLYKYVKWKGLWYSEQTGELTETVKEAVYWFPDNLKSLDELRRKTFSGSKYSEQPVYVNEIVEPSPTITPSPTVTPTERITPTPLSQEEILSLSVDEFYEYVRNTALCNEAEKLSVKAYNSEDWYGYFIGQKRFVRLGIDFGVFENYENGITRIHSLYYSHPETVFRKMPDGMYYTAFASELGRRVFWFATEENRLATLVGYPVLIYPGELKKHEEFMGISEGCTLVDVMKIDPTVREYYDLFYLHSTVSETNLLANKSTLRFTTVHYLADGILEFGYGALGENGDLVITEIRYSPDYTLEDCRGRKIVYRINPLDLP